MGQSSKESKKAWLDRNKEKRPAINRNWKLRNVYGISPEEFEQLCISQNYKCAICGDDLVFNKTANGAHLDHEHKTKWVRGVLCGPCNLGLGKFKDDPDILANAAKYLIDNVAPPEFVFTRVPNPPAKRTEEWKKGQSLRSLGNKYRIGKGPWNKGKAWDKDSRYKMSESAKRRCRMPGAMNNLISAGKLGAAARRNKDEQ
jgi:hypothetical protein